MLFALTRSNLLRQLADRNEIIRLLAIIVAGNGSITPMADKPGNIYKNCYK